MLKFGKIIEDTRNKNSKSPKKNTDEGLTTTGLFSLLIDEKAGRKNKNSIKVLILHDEHDSEYAEILAEKLNKEMKITAIADSQLSVFKMMCFVSYITAAIEWADAVVVLVTNRYREDIKDAGTSLWHPSGSLHTRHGFKVLQNKVDYDNSFPVVAVVQEGMQHNCYEFVEIKKCVHVKNDLKMLIDTICDLYYNSENRTS